MKKNLISSLAGLMVIMGSWTLASAQNVVGVGGSYGMDYEEIGISVGYYHDLSSAVPKLRLGGGFTYFLPKETELVTLSYLMIEANAQYLFLKDESMGVYALGGVRHSRISTEPSEAAKALGVAGSKDNNETGVQLGAGGEFKVGGIMLFAEGILGLGDVDELVVNFGARFPL